MAVKEFTIDNPKGAYYIYRNGNLYIGEQFWDESDAQRVCDDLNRHAALEAVCREIVATISTKEALGVDGQYEYQIARKLKAVLEEK